MMKSSNLFCLFSATTFLVFTEVSYVSAARPVSSDFPLGFKREDRSSPLSYKATSTGIDVLVSGLPANIRLYTRRITIGYEITLESPSTPFALKKDYELLVNSEVISSAALNVNGNMAKLVLISASPQPPSIRSTGSELVISFSQTNPSLSKSLQSTTFLNTPRPQSITQPSSRPLTPAVGSIVSGVLPIPNPGIINLSGPRITLNANGLNAEIVLQYIAARGGYDIVFVKSNPTSSGSQSLQSTIQPVPPALPSSSGVSTVTSPQGTMASSAQVPLTQSTPSSGVGGGSGIDNPRLISLTLTSKQYSKAFNAVLLAAGLQATVREGVIYVGPDLVLKNVGERISKTFRLNQVNVDSAAQFLGNLGASMTSTVTLTTSTSSGVSPSASPAGSSSSTSTVSQTTSQLLTYGANVGPLLGLSGTTDPRLKQLTVIGEPALVQLAGDYLRRLDLRTRQVALTIKVYDVDLTNNLELSNKLSFADGKAILTSDPENSAVGVVIDGSQRRREAPGTPFTTGETVKIFGSTDEEFQPSGIFREGSNRGVIYDVFKALESSQSSKLLASPTVILQENYPPFGVPGQPSSQPLPNEATISVGDKIIEALQPVEGATGCSQAFGTSGLNLKAILTQIDDNGYVSFQINQDLSYVIRKERIPGCGSQTIDLTSERLFNSGVNRIKDGQTLILTGVLNERDTITALKVPLLGDIPIVGSLFRSTSSTRKKSELVITITPRILKDDNSDLYDYYTPYSRDARKVIGDK